MDQVFKTFKLQYKLFDPKDVFYRLYPVTKSVSLFRIPVKENEGLALPTYQLTYWEYTESTDASLRFHQIVYGDLMHEYQTRKWHHITVPLGKIPT